MTTQQMGSEDGLPAVKDKAAQVGGTAQEQAGAVASAAKEQAGQVVTEARTQAGNVVNQAKDQLGQQAHEQKQRLARNVREAAQQLSVMADSAEPGSTAQSVVSELARRGEGLSSYLERDTDRIFDDLQSYARRHPGKFIVGAAAAGVLVGRLGRATVSAATNESPDSTAPRGRSDRAGEYDTRGYSADAGLFSTEPIVSPEDSTARMDVHGESLR